MAPQSPVWLWPCPVSVTSSLIPCLLLSSHSGHSSLPTVLALDFCTRCFPCLDCLCPDFLICWISSFEYNLLRETLTTFSKVTLSHPIHSHCLVLLFSMSLITVWNYLLTYCPSQQNVNSVRLRHCLLYSLLGLTSLVCTSLYVLIGCICWIHHVK